MDCVPNEVLFEVLSFLNASQIASVTILSKSYYRRVRDTGCVSTDQSFRKAISIHELPTKYTNHFIFETVPRTAGAVTFRVSPLLYNDVLTRKIILQLLTLVKEHSAALWVARHGGHPDPNHRSSASIFLYQKLNWDFLTYTFFCNAVEMSTSPTLHLHIRSMPGIMDGGRCLKTSAQPFLCNVLCHTRLKVVTLRLHGTPESSNTSVSRAWMQEERGKVDAFFGRPSWGDDVRLYSQTSFRSSTLGLGVIFTTINPRLKSLHLSHYTFDERGRSMDAAYLTSWLSKGGHDAFIRVHLEGILFEHGADYCDLLRGLCRIETLRHLCLSNIDYISDPPVDPAAILFQDGRFIKELRMIHTKRPLDDLPFHLLTHTAFSTLKLSRMFIESTSIHALTAILPSLPSHIKILDLSSNGLDGLSLALFSSVLASPHCRLERLNLSSNVITSSHIESFCRTLQTNKSLCTLNLSDNFLGTQSCLLLIQALLRNSSHLKSIHLDSNQVRVTMEKLYALLLGEKPGADFRQITLRKNTLDGCGDKDKYKTLFKEMFNVGFAF